MPPPPEARVEVVRDTWFGTTVEDPYRWMEDWESEEARAWIEAQDEHARAALDALPAREALLRRIAELHGDVPRISHLAMAGGRCFALRQDPGASLPVLVVRERPAGPERVLLDTGAGGGEVQRSIDWFVPSPDGRRVALGIAAGGSEESALHVLEVDSGALLDDRIDRVHHGFVSWLDGDALTYHRYREVPPGTPPGEARDDTCSFLHRLGHDPAEDTPLLRRGLHPAVRMAPRDRPFVVVPPRSDWMLAVVSHSALSHTLDQHLSASTIYAAPRAALADPATCPWVEVAGPDRGVIAFALDGERLYLVVHQDAPRHQVVELALGDGTTAERVVVPESERVVLAVRPLGDRLVIRDLAGTVGRLREVPLPGGAPREVPLPVEGAISEWATSADSGELLLKVDSWTRSPCVLHYDAATGAVTDTGWAPPSPVDFSEVEARELLAPARDGTPIPVSVIHRRGLRLDGANPTLLTGYGSYGITLDPAFEPEMLAWYERGGVYAVAHLRGGGEYGRQWHEAGRLLNKETTITDFVDCAEFLVRDGWTRAALLAGEGGSAGGIPTGGALVRRPDLWAAMVMQVPVTNALRAEFSPNGPINTPEFGSVTTEEGLRALLLIDAYQRVRDGVEYPAVLLTAGMNDPRVAVWQPGKLAARLQAATASTAPVLLRVERHAGHGFGSTQRQRDELLADLLAFLLDRFGIEAARPGV